MTNKTATLALIIALATLVMVLMRPASNGVAPAPKKETAFERVMRTNTLRCGYGTWQPGVYKDLQTGKMAGLFVELIEQMGKLNGLKIDWVAEIDWGQIAESINSQKIDAFCAGMAGDAARGRRLAYTNPLSFWTFDVLVRADDNRFPAAETISIADLNKADYVSAFTEGDVLETIVINEFPNVKGVPLPPLGTPADNIMYVTSHKTDFVVFPKVMFQSYEKANPGKLRYLKVTPPLRAYGNVIAVAMDDLPLQQLLNAAVNELVNSGTYTQIMNRYDQNYPGAFLRIAPTYSTSQKP
jgi:ABC-type amino acid transport substrate-binding protein